MKSFLKMLLATILGGIILFFLVFVFIASLASLAEPKIVINDNSVLKVNINTMIYERTQDNPFSSFDPFTGQPENALGLNNFLKALESAKDDDRIKGLYLKGGIPLTGSATLREMREAIQDFKESGKFVYSYSEVMTQKGYYLASEADSVFMNPEGFLEWKGLAASVTYMKEALDKLGVEPVVLRATGNKFKSAVEPYMRQDMSEANRTQINQLLGSVWNNYLTDIASSRSLTSEQLNAIADEFVVTDPKDALKKGLLDGTIYYDELTELMTKRTGVESIKDLEFISVGKYVDGVGNSGNGNYKSDRIAVIIAQGEIVGGEGNEYTIGSYRISKAIREARKNDKVKAIVLRVNSPGGSALASEIIWREVDLARQEKPVVASMGDLAASGGYYISCFADTIVAQPNTITGSIGAFGLFFTGEKLMHETLGLNIETVTTNPYADLGTFDRSLTDGEMALLIAQVDKVYGTFKSRVAEGRDLDVNYVDSIGQGRVWSGTDAKERGLVDVIGGLDDAIEIAANMADLEGDYRIVEYPKLEDPIQKLVDDLMGGYESKIIEKNLGEYARYFELIQKVQERQGYQTRMEFDLVID